MDPILLGNTIFQEIIKDYPNQIKDPFEAVSLLERIIHETRGLAILDFIDYGGWDKISSVSYDENDNVFHLYWHENGQEGKRGSSRDGLCFVFQELVTYSNDSLSGIFFRGYSIKKNKIRKILSNHGDDLTIEKNRNFFCEFKRTVNFVKESFRFLNSPIYSFAIIPKNTILKPSDSQELLFEMNFQYCIDRLRNRQVQLLQTDQYDCDTICEKANTGRRYFEFVLKIECCLVEHHVSFLGFEKTKEAKFKKEYNKMMLGDLKGVLLDFKPENRQKALGEIVQISNKLSHDSGEEINKIEATRLFELMIDYTAELVDLVKDYFDLKKHYTQNLEKSKCVDILKKKSLADLRNE